MSRITFLTGPVRSGKSRRAVELAAAWGAGTVFIATCRPPVAGPDGAPSDPEMAARIRRHRAERPATWRVLEAPRDIPAALDALRPPPAGVLLDCLTLWASDRLDLSDDALIAEWDRLLAHLRAAPCPAVIVGNEIGWSPVPEHPGLRRFRDLVGILAQHTAAAATEAHLCLAGQTLRLK
jgi:adenosyl cobinamide kinase/adenosyl cobinamide phosphate guanylyltransferase